MRALVIFVNDQTRKHRRRIRKGKIRKSPGSGSNFIAADRIGRCMQPSVLVNPPPGKASRERKGRGLDEKKEEDETEAEGGRYLTR